MVSGSVRTTEIARAVVAVTLWCPRSARRHDSRPASARMRVARVVRSGVGAWVRGPARPAVVATGVSGNDAGTSQGSGDLIVAGSIVTYRDHLAIRAVWRSVRTGLFGLVFSLLVDPVSVCHIDACRALRSDDDAGVSVHIHR